MSPQFESTTERVTSSANALLTRTYGYEKSIVSKRVPFGEHYDFGKRATNTRDAASGKRPRPFLAASREI
jgi:hypothetical protein